MRMFSGSLVLLLATAVTAYGQGAGESVVKFPDQLDWKAPPLIGGASTAILYGDPAKATVYVTRTKFPAGIKVLPHTHPDEWRTVVVLSGTIYFGLGEIPPEHSTPSPRIRRISFGPRTARSLCKSPAWARRARD